MNVNTLDTVFFPEVNLFIGGVAVFQFQYLFRWRFQCFSWLHIFGGFNSFSLDEMRFVPEASYELFDRSSVGVGPNLTKFPPGSLDTKADPNGQSETATQTVVRTSNGRWRAAFAVTPLVHRPITEICNDAANYRLVMRRFALFGAFDITTRL